MLWSFFTAAQLLSKHMNPIGIQGVIPGCRVQNDLKHHVKITWHIASNKRCSRHHHTKHLPIPLKKICLSAKALLVEPAECSPDHTEPWHLKPRLSCSSKKGKTGVPSCEAATPPTTSPEIVRKPNKVAVGLYFANVGLAQLWVMKNLRGSNGKWRSTADIMHWNGVLVLNPHPEPHFCRETSWLLPLRCP